jgi:hypothetical protein
MDKKLFGILKNFRPCFSRVASYQWFLVIMIGLVVRGDFYGVSSIVRWLSLTPCCYWTMLHFFHSTGWTLEGLQWCWWSYCFQDTHCLKVQGRSVMVGDHTNQPKEGRKMPGLVTIHQDSETSSKPSYYRGHVWCFIALVVERAQKCFAVPLRGELDREEINKKGGHSKATRTVYNAIRIAEKMNCPSYQVLDSYFAIGPIFLLAAGVYSVVAKVPWVHVITRAKKNTVAYLDPEPAPPGKRGPKKKYGKKLTLKDLFTDRASEFVETTCCVYGHTEVVKVLCLDLLWKPVKGKVRFVLAITSRGPIVMMCSDLALPAVHILELYCRRASIESTFWVLKNLIGGLAYHFWSKQIERKSRRPQRNKNKSSDSPDQKIPVEVVEDKLRAIELFVNLSAIMVGILQILSLQFPEEIWKDNLHWLRTVSNNIPSEYIVKGVLAQTILKNLNKVNAHAIYTLIRSRQTQSCDFQQLERAA